MRDTTSAPNFRFRQSCSMSAQCQPLPSVECAFQGHVLPMHSVDRIRKDICIDRLGQKGSGGVVVPDTYLLELVLVDVACVGACICSRLMFQKASWIFKLVVSMVTVVWSMKCVFVELVYWSSLRKSRPGQQVVEAQTEAVTRDCCSQTGEVDAELSQRDTAADITHLCDSRHSSTMGKAWAWAWASL